MPYRSPFPDFAIPDVNFADFVLERTAEFRSLVAVEEIWSGRRYNYAQLEEVTRCVATHLIDRGLSKGDVVCMYSKNCLENMPLFLGLIAAGGTVNLMKPMASDEEMVRLITESQPKFVITSAERAETMATASRKSGIDVHTIFVIGQDGASSDELCQPAKVLLESTSADHRMSVESHDVAVLQLTGGTTGTPKLVMNTHQSLVASLTTCDRMTSPTFDRIGESMLAYFPFNSLMPLMAVHCLGLRKGHRILLMNTMKLSALLEMVQQHRVPALVLLPSQITTLLSPEDLLEKYDVSSLSRIYCAGAMVSKEVHKKIENRIKRQNANFQFSQGYGMTEFCGAVAGPLSGSNGITTRPGSVGVLAPMFHCKVVSLETGEELGPGHFGELLLRGPQMMLGYYKRSDLTAAAICDGWYRTNDFGRFDNEGFLYVADRIGDLIHTNHGLIPPSCVESVLHSIPAVADCAVLGIGGSDDEEMPFAFVVLQSEMSCAQLAADVNSRIETGGQLLEDWIRIVPSIPRNNSKIQRSLLRKQLKGGSSLL